MDIVQKIREELVRLKKENNDKYDSYDQVRLALLEELGEFIDSLQEESESSVWHDMSEDAENGRNIIIIDPKDFYGAVLRKGGSQLKNHNKERYVKWAYIDDVINLSNVERTTKDLKEETVNEELEDFAKRQADEFAEREYEVDSYDRGYLSKGYYWGCKAGAQWQKEQMMAKAVDVTIAIPYPRLDGVYTQLVDSKEALPFGDNIKVLVIKED